MQFSKGHIYVTIAFPRSLEYALAQVVRQYHCFQHDLRCSMHAALDPTCVESVLLAVTFLYLRRFLSCLKPYALLQAALMS